MRLTLVIFSLLYLNWLWASCLIVRSKSIWWRLLQEISSIFCRKWLDINPVFCSYTLWKLIFIIYSSCLLPERAKNSQSRGWASSGVKLPLQNLVKSALAHCWGSTGVFPSGESCMARRAVISIWWSMTASVEFSLLSGKVLNWHFDVSIVILQVRMTGSHSLTWWFSSWKSIGSPSWFVVLFLPHVSALHGDMQ